MAGPLFFAAAVGFLVGVVIGMFLMFLHYERQEA